MTVADSDPASPGAEMRATVARWLLRLPRPVSEIIWQSWRDVDRARRRRRENRGDYTHSSPALYEMDAKLTRHLDLSRPGFFVEAGANDGYHQSNTYRLERAHGWRGIMIEPEPSLFRAATRERSRSTVVNCALVPEDHEAATVRLVYGGMMTTVVGARDSAADDHAWVAEAHAAVQEKPEHEFEVPARSLSSILDEQAAPEIDLLSLDVEGFEVQVLKGLDLERHAPRWFLVEIREGGTSREQVEEVLGDRYVSVEQLSPFDVLYRRVDVATG
jgi:FkbM family methyltransferase